MIKKLFSRKLLALFGSMAIIGFFIGYDYALITSKGVEKNVVNISDRMKSGNHGSKPDVQVEDNLDNSAGGDMEEENSNAENEAVF